MFVSIHIPKTAGTALGYVFDYSSGRRIFWDYDKDYRYPIEIQSDIKENIQFIRKYFQFIHGHFYYQKYADLLSDEKFITSVRHPVSRVVSQYYHVAAGSDWRTELIKTGKMNAVEFARSDRNISEALSRHLMGRKIEEYDHVFLTENLSEGMKIFSKKFDFSFLVSVPSLNTNAQRTLKLDVGDFQVPKVTEEDRRQIYNVCIEDVDVYVRAKERLVAEVSKYL